MKRGDIYYISIPHHTGSEMDKARPGVIVSCDALNNTSPVVTVVFLTATPKHGSPGHVTIASTPRLSTALCEQIYTVDKTRLTTKVGEATETEMDAIEAAISATLGLPETEGEGTVIYTTPPVGEPSDEAESLRAELEVYKRLYGDLLDRLTKIA